MEILFSQDHSCNYWCCKAGHEGKPLLGNPEAPWNLGCGFTALLFAFPGEISVCGFSLPEVMLTWRAPSFFPSLTFYSPPVLAHSSSSFFCQELTNSISELKCHYHLSFFLISFYSILIHSFWTSYTLLHEYMYAGRQVWEFLYTAKSVNKLIPHTSFCPPNLNIAFLVFFFNRS